MGLGVAERKDNAKVKMQNAKVIDSFAFYILHFAFAK
jgi:hypothetical protein